MSYVTWKVYHTPYDGGTWDTSERTELPDFRDVELRVALGETKDSFQFKVVNNFGRYDDFFGPKDKIEIYRVVSSDVVGTDPMMIGIINDNPVELDYKQNIFRVKGNNFSEGVMDAIAFFDADGEVVPEAIKKGLDSVKGFNENFAVEWDRDNPTVRTDKTAFPAVYEQVYWKPIKKFIEQYSSNVGTDDVNYYWYVNNRNKFIWKPNSGFGSGTFDDSVDGYKSLKTKKDLSGIRNLIVCQGGLDPAGKPIQVPYFNNSSIASVGIKFHILISEQNSAQTLVDQDKEDSNQTGTFPQAIEDGNSFITKWKATESYTTKDEGVEVTRGDYVEIDKGSISANKRAYTEVIREETVIKLKKEAEIFSQERQYGIFMMDIELMPGQKSWGLGDVITVQIKQYKNGESTQLRVKEVQYTTISDTYTLQEDEGTVGQE